jgi:hypothetical protein
VKRFLTILAGVVFGVALLGAGALTLLWLFCDNSVQVDIRNDSGASLQKVAVIVPGATWSPPPQDMEPGGGCSFSTGDTSKPRRSLPVRVVFDAARHHYDVPRHLPLAPFGSYYVKIRIDERMRVSFDTKFL